MSVDPGEARYAIADTGFWTNDEEPQAYSGDTAVDYPETGAKPYQSATDGGTLRRNRWALSAAALLVAAAAFVMAGAHVVKVLTAPPAAAATVTVTLPPVDRNAAFLADLARDGVPVSDAVGAVHNGYLVCVALISGQTEWQVVDGVIARSDKTGLPKSKAGSFVFIAQDHYCPNGHL